MLHIRPEICCTLIKQLEEAIALFDKSVTDDEAIGVRNKLREVVA